MNFSQLKASAANRCKLEGWGDVSPAPDWGNLINRGLYKFSWEAEYRTNSASFVTVVGQADYDVTNPPDWKRFTDVVYNGVTTLRLTDEATLRREVPNWTTAPNGIPERYFLSSPNTIRLYPTPNTNGVTISVRGIQAEAALVNETDSPDCAELYEEGIVLMAVWEHAKQYAKGEARARVKEYLAEAKDLAKDCRLYLAEQAAPAMIRRVERTYPETRILW